MTDEPIIKRGKPASFGWLRRPEHDWKHRTDIEAWERPDGKIIQLRPGAELIRVSKFRGIISRFKRNDQ